MAIHSSPKSWRLQPFVISCKFLILMESSLAQRWIRKFRILTVCLIVSGAINLGALAILIAFLVQQHNETLSYPALLKNKTAMEQTANHTELSRYGRLSFRELAALLTHTDFVEEGYRKRDLALSALVSKHYFNLEKALGGPPSQKRVFKVDDTSYLLFPGLTDDQFQAIIRFAYLEKWPLTGEGLFALLQKSRLPRDASLEQAFILTPEFYSLSALFQKCERSVSQADLIGLACNGTWPMLETLVHEQSQMLDLSIDKRRELLLKYLSMQSPFAAKLLIHTDFDFALKRLEDQNILDLLCCLKDISSDRSQRFCIELLQSSRSDLIWHKSAELLYHNQDVEMPLPFDREVALVRFGVKSEVVEASSPPLPVNRHHIVQDGENLWKIARLYKVSVDQIVLLNGLEKETIRPGMILQIPSKN